MFGRKKKAARQSQEEMLKRITAQTERTIRQSQNFLAMSQDFTKVTNKMLERR